MALPPALSENVGVRESAEEVLARAEGEPVAEGDVVAVTESPPVAVGHFEGLDVPEGGGVRGAVAVSPRVATALRLCGAEAVPLRE